MKRLQSVFLLIAAPLATVVGCEGEPPVMAPENAAGSQVAVVSAPEATQAEAPTGCPPPPCAHVAPTALVASMGASAPAEAYSAAVLPVPPQASKRGIISGTVTAQPGNVARTEIVYMEEHPGDTNPEEQTVTIDNKQMTFTPYVQVVSVEGKVLFANSDPFPHNIYSPDNGRFNLGNVPPGGAVARVFHTPGAYTLLCNLHPGMLGYLVVTPSTHFVRVGAKGHYSMRDVPIGTWNVYAWAPRQTKVTQSVTVTEGEVTANFDLH